MPIPAGIQTVTVTGSAFGAGVDATGVIEFIPGRVLYAALKEIGLPTQYRAPLVAGAFAIVLPANDAPEGNPTNGQYRVVERVTGGADPYSIAVLAANGPTQDLATLAPVTSAAGTPVVVGPRGPAGTGVAITDNLDGSITLTLAV